MADRALMRRPVRQKARSQIVSLQPPIKGLMLNQPPGGADPLGAEVIENGIPTNRGIRMRGGLQKSATVGANPVKSLFAYRTTGVEALFAATAGAVYDISTLNPLAAPVADIADQTAGYYASQQIGTAGGDYLYIVNGSDFAWLYDGGAWNPVTTVAVSNLAYDGLTLDFTKGETVTGGTSGASAVILAVIPATATTGTMKLGAITAGPFQNNEAITSAGGAAVANGASAAASSVVVTGVATSVFSHVWLYRSRLFFVQKDTLSAWYLPVDSIGGAAVDLSLAGIFQRGGTLLFGATWSLDSGSGLDDKCVFVSTEGEIAIYEGGDPSDPADWNMVGRYDVAKPLGINASMQAGGDLLIATVDGIVPLSQVISKDPAALSLSAVTKPIETLWNRVTSGLTEPVELLKWTDRGLGVVTLPEWSATLLVNLQTGAWGVQTGWIANCAETFIGMAYIGLDDGSICAIDESGQDITEPYTMRICWPFSDLGDSTGYKVAQLVRPSFYAAQDVFFKAGVATNYTPDFSTAPTATEITASEEYIVWDVDNWDEKFWWSAAVEDQGLGIIAKWRSVTGAGFALAPTIQITSGQSQKPNIEIVRMDIAFEVGGSVV